jgi:hypothetical protein
MKKILFLLLLISSQALFSQCPINPFIQENYELDAKVLALREIINNTSDPDYNNPYIPQGRITPYLEKLSAIYDNPINNSSIDSLFNEFQIHANWEFFGTPNQAPFKFMQISINSSAPWLEDFLNTGVSGFEDLDVLMNEYLFSIHSYIEIQSIQRHLLLIETSIDFLNITALLDDFISIEDIESSYPTVLFVDRFNYTGIPYTINGEPIEVSNIIANEEVFKFSIYAGDCPSGCLYSKNWNVQLSEDCEITLLTNQENKTTLFSVHPNPVSEVFQINNLENDVYSIKIYSPTGKLISDIKNAPTSINISGLNSGIYFVEITNSKGDKQVSKIIKK